MQKGVASLFVCKNLFIIVWNLFTKYGIIIVYCDLKVEEKYILNKDY